METPVSLLVMAQVECCLRRPAAAARWVNGG
jgi:hypothetical protein